jgi:hypothetical protein
LPNFEEEAEEENISQRTLHICKIGDTLRLFSPVVERGSRYSRSMLAEISAVENNQLNL